MKLTRAGALLAERVRPATRRFRSGLVNACAELQALEAAASAQEGLERNLTLLRETLYGYGPPTVTDGKLFFGLRCLNDDCDAVDRVRRETEGAATVFLGDLRISTTVMGADGQRAVGTRLAPGPVHDTVLGASRSFRGETSILGRPYFAIYEPVLVDGEAVGVLFVGVPKADRSAAEATAQTRASGEALIGALQALARDRRAREAVALRDRQAADDQRIRQEAGRQRAQAEQREVVQALSEALSRLATGDLTGSFQTDLPNGYRQLQLDFERALMSLRGALGRIAQGAHTVDGAASEITRAADELAQRTEDQAASLEETAAALDQITATVEQTAQGARSATESVAAARRQAQSSGELVRGALEAMVTIETSAKRIHSIADVMDEVARMTNLLALNAGIEAARAGDAGRGFALIAQEVRKLAQNSSASAQEVRELIVASERDIVSGMQLAESSGRSVDAMVARMGEVDDLVAQIAGSAREQATALGQVNRAVNNMDRVSQQNAAMVDQTTAASHALRQEAGALIGAVGGFKVATQSENVKAPLPSPHRAPVPLRVVSQAGRR